MFKPYIRFQVFTCNLRQTSNSLYSHLSSLSSGGLSSRILGGAPPPLLNSDPLLHLYFRLRERELQLQSDLTTASREINRLRINLKQTNLTHTRLQGQEDNLEKH